jgi:hypothetical protein
MCCTSTALLNTKYISCRNTIVKSEEFWQVFEYVWIDVNRSKDNYNVWVKMYDVM